MLLSGTHLAIVLAYGAGMATAFMLYLGPRWMTPVMPFVTAFAASALIGSW